jgi:hypothetical protein
MDNEMRKNPHLLGQVLDVGDIVICANPVLSFDWFSHPMKGLWLMYQRRCPRAPSDPERSRTRFRCSLENDFSTRAEMTFGQRKKPVTDAESTRWTTARMFSLPGWVRKT